ncbi:anti-sigma factor family protein [Aggregatilinea lenta]|uniref:anti-sigma factor family protein n=1 Tax=Aggregatilinea lenta TaxID=913108 RepID=UPI000E5B7B37|nr:zf-HC2 domain-containing protein [Aggregatilinea lenta]
MSVISSHHHDHTHDHSECQRYLTSLTDYVDGDLDPALCRELETHMAACENCRVVVNTLTKTISLYRQLPAPEMPNAVKERLYAVLDLKPHTLSADEGGDPA